MWMPLANNSYYGNVANGQKGVVHVFTSTGWHNGLNASGSSRLDTSAAAAGFGADTWHMQFTEEDKDGDNNEGTAFNITLDSQTDGDLEVSTVNAGNDNLKEVDGTVVSEGSDILGDDDNVVTRISSDLATIVRRIGPSSSQRSAEITYHGEEAYAEIYLTDASGSTGGGVLGSVAVLDDELASSGMQTKNLILVGGTCVNSAAATALNVGAGTCGADWTAATGSGPGSWIIQSMANPWSSAKVATVVAGYEQGDTVNAATAFTTQDIDTSVNQKYTGTTGTSATPVVS
jgi:hypothetical protein